MALNKNETKRWVCENCPLDKKGCGPFYESEKMFGSCKKMHASHPGWKEYTPTNEDENPLMDNAADVAAALSHGFMQNRFRELQKDLTFKIIEKGKIIEFEPLQDEIKKLRPLSVYDDTAYVLIYLPAKGKIIEQGKKDKEEVVVSYFQSNIPYYINSKKEICLAKDGSLNQEFQLPELGIGEAVRWDPLDVFDYIDSNEKVDLKHVFEQISSQVKSLIELKTNDYLSVFVLWAIGTYFYRLFEYYPYLDFSGSKGSGKTKAQVILLCLCFNARMSHKITGPNWARNVDALNCTILIDEQEDLLEPKTEHASNLINLLNSAFRTDADQPISIPLKELGWGSKTFDIGVPVAIAHITPLNDVTEDRAIPMKMIVSKDKKILDNEVEQRNSSWGRLRDLVYRAYLENFKEVEEIRRETINLENISARERNQIWKPILTLAKLFERHGVAGLQESVKQVIAETHQIRTINNQTNNKDIQVLELICDLIINKKISPITEKEEHRNWYQQQVLLDEITQDQDLKHLSTKELGSCLERLQLERRKRNPHNTCVFMDRQILINLCQRYNLEYQELLSQASLAVGNNAEESAVSAQSAVSPKIDSYQSSEQCTRSDKSSFEAHQAHASYMDKEQ